MTENGLSFAGFNPVHLILISKREDVMGKIVEYIRKKGQPIGCLVAVDKGDKNIFIGCSLCRKDNVFIKKTAREKAEKRALRQEPMMTYSRGEFLYYFPHSIKKDIQKFVKKVRQKFDHNEIQNYCDKVILTPNKENTRKYFNTCGIFKWGNNTVEFTGKFEPDRMVNGNLNINDLEIGDHNENRRL